MTPNEIGVSSADEVKDLLDKVQELVIPFIRDASIPDSKVLDYHKPHDLDRLLSLSVPEKGLGQEGVLDIIKTTLKYSVNGWSPGFLDKLYASTNAVGVASELLLGVLNTGSHVYHVSPVLTLMERCTGTALARLFGFEGENAGGITFPGGSSSNTHSMVTARNIKFPETKTEGLNGRKFVVFNSAHGHYSVEKAAILCGFGSKAVWSVPIDSLGRMIPSELEKLVIKAKEEGYTPFYVNATAGTTVMGSFDPIRELATLCRRHDLWLHVDGSWGGSVIFSDKYKHLLDGSELADSITINPHKMLGVPLQCSYLILPDSGTLVKSNSLRAGYLFHGDNEEEAQYDLADATMGCGRRPDALKFFLGWSWYGKQGYAARIEQAYALASYFSSTVASRPDFTLLSPNPPSCLQVCFQFDATTDSALNTKKVEVISERLTKEGKFLVDFAPGETGSFFRAVINAPNVSTEFIDDLVGSVERIGKELKEGGWKFD
ncbi:PLP-dependent transferase [Saitoella complicata NRRL Y-17804]|uniref:PLP-dependent transferase n=1 Tax=Saitoella complicata (strain BCRC 22490 / CBS 7301 / JCM 7358 / NBRC 10748 / NRRL Y-17804) TaxID=698492 RepID=UPI000867FFB4|nr:PLP-dependent transferase [Saitoella complicata NRRL Y-17804]ODQ56532.1 PLP-dependent transferase [Saitoella complicata NRRL Y-17804]